MKNLKSLFLPMLCFISLMNNELCGMQRSDLINLAISVNPKGYLNSFNAEDLKNGLELMLNDPILMSELPQGHNIEPSTEELHTFPEGKGLLVNTSDVKYQFLFRDENEVYIGRTEDLINFLKQNSYLKSADRFKFNIKFTKYFYIPEFEYLFVFSKNCFIFWNLSDYLKDPIIINIKEDSEFYISKCYRYLIDKTRNSVIDIKTLYEIQNFKLARP